LDEDVYIAIPQGVKILKPNQICKLLKSLYGLNREVRKWYEKLTSLLISQGYQQSNANHSLFTLKNRKISIALLTYVDDVVLAANCLD